MIYLAACQRLFLGTILVVLCSCQALAQGKLSVQQQSQYLQIRCQPRIDHVCLSPDGKLLAIAYPSGLEIIDLKRKKSCLFYVVGLDHRVHAVSFTPDSTQVYIAHSGVLSDKPGIRLIKIATAETQGELSLPEKVSVDDIVISPNGTRSAIVLHGRDDHQALLWNCQFGQNAKKDSISGCTAAAFLNGNDEWIEGGYAGTVTVASFDYKQVPRSLARQVNTVHYLQVSPDGKQLIVLTRSTAIRVLNIAGNKEIEGSFKKHKPEAATFYNSNRIVTGNEDGSLRIWSLDIGKTVDQLNGHAKSIMYLGASISERILVSCDENEARVWAANEVKCSRNRRAGPNPDPIRIEINGVLIPALRSKFVELLRVLEESGAAGCPARPARGRGRDRAASRSWAEPGSGRILESISCRIRKRVFYFAAVGACLPNC